MQSRFWPGFILVATTSMLLAFGCSSDQSDSLDSDNPALDETNADWVRVDVGLSTSHPYENNQEENWELQAPEEAQGIRVHFNEFQTEEGQDFFVLGEHIYHGSLGSFTTDVAPGHLIPVQFSTDESISHYGYDIDYYEYLMPHTAFHANGIKPKSDSFQTAEQKLRLGSSRHAHPHFITPAPFEEEHYEELIEHELIYRCWNTIIFINIPEPLTLELEPTSLFSLKMIRETPARSVQSMSTMQIFNGKPLNININLKNAKMGPRMSPKIMSQTTIKTGAKSIKLNTQAVKSGFGAWKLTQFNQKSQHASSSPQLKDAKHMPFKLHQPKQKNKKTPQIFMPFKLKNFKI